MRWLVDTIATVADDKPRRIEAPQTMADVLGDRACVGVRSLSAEHWTCGCRFGPLAE